MCVCVSVCNANGGDVFQARLMFCLLKKQRNTRFMTW